MQFIWALYYKSEQESSRVRTKADSAQHDETDMHDAFEAGNQRLTAMASVKQTVKLGEAGREPVAAESLEDKERRVIQEEIRKLEADTENKKRKLIVCSQCQTCQTCQTSG